MNRPLLAIATLIFTASAASADPVIITGGSLYLVSPGTGYDPPFGFELTGVDTHIGGITYDMAGGFPSAGAAVNLSRSVYVSATPRYGPSSEIVDGILLTDVIMRGTLDFVARPVTFTGGDGVHAPFTMTGTLSFYRDDPHLEGELLLTAFVRGTGMASLYHFSRPFDAAMSYGFEPAPPTPTPEPGTLALFASGLVAVVGRWRRRRIA